MMTTRTVAAAVILDDAWDARRWRLGALKVEARGVAQNYATKISLNYYVASGNLFIWEVLNCIVKSPMSTYKPFQKYT